MKQQQYSIMNLLLLLLPYLVTAIDSLRGTAILNGPTPRYIGSCRQRNLCCSGRDSSCSVPVATSNVAASSSLNSNSLIGNLINDLSDAKECYCDSACITLADCCPDYKETCGVQDCVVGDWQPWSECNATCGVGTMTRERQVITNSLNGGKECPDLIQRRACHGQHCHVKDDDKMLREMAIILPYKFSVTRNIDEEKDIRRNLRLNYPKDPLKEKMNQYCLLFEITKSHKSCETFTADVYNKLQEGSRVCVHCQDAAMRRHLGYRCYGHGINNKSTPWSMFNFSGCHGRWTRLQEQPAESTNSGQHCQCEQQIITLNTTKIIKMEPDFIFV